MHVRRRNGKMESTHGVCSRSNRQAEKAAWGSERTREGGLRGQKRGNSGRRSGAIASGEEDGEQEEEDEREMASGRERGRRQWWYNGRREREDEGW